MNNTRSLILLLSLSLVMGGCSSLPSWMGGKKEEKAKLEGTRVAVLPVSTALQPDEKLKNVAIVLPPAKINENWAQHTDVATAANGNLGARGAFDTVTHATIGEGEAFEHTQVTRPVVGGGAVFAMDAVGHISAHDAANISTIRWQSKGVAEEDGPQIMGGGLAYDDGKLYVASGRGIVAALDAATGKELWHKTLRLPLRSSPTVADGKLFVVTLDNQLYVLSAANGDTLWNHRGIGETAGLMNSVSPAVAGGTVIVPYSSGELYALSTADGKEIWNGSLSSGQRTQASALFAGIGGDPVIDGSVVFAASSGGMISVVAMTTGQRLWDRPIGAINTPWVAGDYLFMLSSDNTLICFVKYDGRIRWATKLATFANELEKKEPITWRGPVLVDGKLAVVGSNGQLLLVSATDGTIAATKTVAENIYTPPVVAGGRMYLVGQDAVLYELQ